MRTDAYALGLTFLQLLSGASKPTTLVARAQVALEECTLGTHVSGYRDGRTSPFSSDAVV